jgi:hypothetical protein
MKVKIENLDFPTVKVQELCIPITYKRLREEGKKVQRSPLAIIIQLPSLSEYALTWNRPHTVTPRQNE